jgi:copper ion binding protein
MKTLKCGLIILAGFVIALMNLTDAKAGVQEIQKHKTITIKLNSIQCGMCVDIIEKAISDVDGVRKVKVNLDKKIATVTYDTGKTTKAKIENAITSAGYNANNKIANKEAYDKLAGCCKVK